MIRQQISAGWRELNGFAKLALAVFLLLQLPVLYLVFNNLTCEFSLDRSAYEHLSQILRLYDGLPLYSPLSVEFNVITYTPLYWWICSLIWRLVGPGFLSPQLVSLVASLAFFYFAARFVWEGTSRNLFLTVFGVISLVWVGLFTGFWLFQIHVDALHFALTIAGFYCLKKSEPRSLVLAAVWLSLGALTKQTGLAYVAAGGLYVLLQSPRKVLFYAVPALLVCGGGLAFLQLQSGGLFYDIVVRQNQGPPRDPARLWSEVWGAQFLGQALLMLVFALWPLVSSKTVGEAWRRLLTPEYVMAASGILVACIAQPKMGSGNNHAVIAFAGLVICGLEGLQGAAGQFREARMGRTFLAAVVVLQQVVLMLPAWKEATMRFLDAVDRSKYEQVADVFRKGNTILYHFPYISRSFGYPEGGHQGNETCRWIDGKWSWANKPDFLNVPYREQRYDYVILCASVVDRDDPTIQAIMENYSLSMTLPPHPTKPNTLMLRYPVFVLKANRLANRPAVSTGGKM